jgi:tRNA-specific 2-thiouridylase
MKVLCAMSGGVDSSAAALELLRAGHEVVGVTMRLWGGASDTGCCSIADVDDARRVAQQLGIDHVVFNFTDEFDTHVVDPYVQAHTRGDTPNPCIECNRHLVLGFDAVATGHHARIVLHDGLRYVARGADAAKDQSYVVHMLSQADLARTLFPVGHLTKAEVRERAAAAGLRTAAKPDSQDVCFITHTGGREAFLGDRIAFRPATVVDTAGVPVGRVEAVELVTVGQRRGLGLPGGGPKRYVVDVDVDRRTVVVGDDADQFDTEVELGALTWAVDPVAQPDALAVRVQCSAHGATRSGKLIGDRVVWDEPQRRVAPGQSVVLYDLTDTRVLAGAVATRPVRPSSHR